MQNVLILGGGVGGTLVANLISRKVKKQIDAMAGTIAVDSVVDQGTTFTISLPASRAPETKDES